MIHNRFSGGLMGGFFGNMFEQMELERKTRIRKELGITTNEHGLEGNESLNIPHKYDTIEIASWAFDETDKALRNYFYCYSQSGTLITLYKNDGTFMFDCNRVEYYKQDMFLVGKKKEVVIVGKERSDEFGFSLYHQETKLTEPIFTPKNMSYFNEEGFAVVGTFGEFSRDKVINKSGEIVFQTKDYHSPYLRGVLCSCGDVWTNLLTGEVICKGYQSINTREFYFIKVDDNCIYQINIKTGEYSIHGELKKEEPKPALINLEVPRTPKEKVKVPNRNDACLCGSGKKFKHCCIDKVA